MGSLFLFGGIMDAWHEGFPKKPGWYHCKLDGGEVDLYCKRCELTGKYHWLWTDGSYIEEKVLWRETN